MLAGSPFLHLQPFPPVAIVLDTQKEAIIKTIETLVSCDNTGLEREVIVSLPSQAFMRSELRLLYCTDGLATSIYSKRIADELSLEWPIGLVGVACDPLNRAEEYVVGRDDDAYARHQEFFTQTVPNWLHSEFGITATRDRTALFGYSCGGNFVSALAIAHPGKYRGAIAMSVAGRPVRVDLEPDPELDLAELKFYLAAGSSEMSGMKNYMFRLEEWLVTNGASCKFSLEEGAGHDLHFWMSELYHAVPWIFR